MSELMTSLLLALTVAVSVSAGDFSGQMELYRDTYYRNSLATIKITKSNRCFNLVCGDYNDVLSSAKWTGLPKTATYAYDPDAHVVFYVDGDCMGVSKRFRTTMGGVSTFEDIVINDAVSSFMVVETSNKVENGETSICDESIALNASAIATT